MEDFCDCAHCHHYCGEDEESEAALPVEDASADSENSDEEDLSAENTADKKVMAEKTSEAEAMAVKKVEKLKRAIRALGFKLKDTEEGIRVMM